LSKLCFDTKFFTLGQPRLKTQGREAPKKVLKEPTECLLSMRGPSGRPLVFCICTECLVFCICTEYLLGWRGQLAVQKHPLYRLYMCSSCRKIYFHDIFSRWKLSQFRYLCQSNALPSHIKVNSKIIKFEQINVFLFDLVYVISCLIPINIKVNSKITKFEQINVIEL